MLAADTPTPLFGHLVTLTATVGPGNPAAGTPAGTVTFYDGTTPLAQVPLNNGQAGFTTGKLQPGTHQVTAVYSGDPAFEPSATTGPTGITVGFSEPCITTAHHGPLTVGADRALCLGGGGSQDGPVTVRPGGALAVLGAQVHGPLSADGAAALAVCGATIDGPVTVHGPTGYLLLGAGPGATSSCAGNTIHGPVTLDADTGGPSVTGVTVTVRSARDAGAGGG